MWALDAQVHLHMQSYEDSVVKQFLHISLAKVVQTAVSSKYEELAFKKNGSRRDLIRAFVRIDEFAFVALLPTQPPRTVKILVR